MRSLKLTHGLFSQASIGGYISPKCGSKPQREGEMGSGKQMLQQARGRQREFPGCLQGDCPKAVLCGVGNEVVINYRNSKKLQKTGRMVRQNLAQLMCVCVYHERRI